MEAAPQNYLGGMRFETKGVVRILTGFAAARVFLQVAPAAVAGKRNRWPTSH
jgi:hypothetical protein